MKDVDDYICSSSCITVEEKLENRYIVIDTDFERMEVIYRQEQLFSSMDNLIRFIDPEFLELCGDGQLKGIYFVPTHIEHKIREGLSEEIIDSTCNRYLPDSLKVDIEETEYEYEKNLIKSRDRNKYGTSFFQCINMDVSIISETVRLLKKELHVLRNHEVAMGQIVDNCGIIEKSGIKKTEDPESRHCSFWKFENGGTFDEISDRFILLEGENNVS